MKMEALNRSDRAGVRTRIRTRLRHWAVLLGLLALVAGAFPGRSAAQAGDQGTKTPQFWTDPETGQVFTKPGPGRVPFSAAAPLSNEPAKKDIQGLQADTESLKQQLQALTTKDGLRYKGVNVKLGGFIEAAGIYRTRNEVSDVG